MIRVRAIRPDVVLDGNGILLYGEERQLQADEAHALFLAGLVEFVSHDPAIETMDLMAVEQREAE